MSYHHFNIKRYRFYMVTFVGGYYWGIFGQVLRYRSVVTWKAGGAVGSHTIKSRRTMSYWLIVMHNKLEIQLYVQTIFLFSIHSISFLYNLSYIVVHTKTAWPQKCYRRLGLLGMSSSPMILRKKEEPG